MTTFARSVGGFLVDIQTAASATELAARFHPDWLAKNTFIVVPDGMLHGAVDNGNGTYINHKPATPDPIQPPPPPPPDPIEVLTAKVQALSDAIAVAVPAAAPMLKTATGS